MPRVRKFLAAISLVLLLGFSASLVEWHSDHDGCAQGVAQTCSACCIQCCPSHHLPPLVRPGILLASPRPPSVPVDGMIQCASNPIPLPIDRPPIA